VDEEGGSSAGRTGILARIDGWLGAAASCVATVFLLLFFYPFFYRVQLLLIAICALLWAASRLAHGGGAGRATGCSALALICCLGATARLGAAALLGFSAPLAAATLSLAVANALTARAMRACSRLQC
jgi:hypothetical protein